MKNTVIIIILLLLLGTDLFGQSSIQYSFFSNKDVENIRNSVDKECGQLIIDSLKMSVENRLSYPMEVPVLEGGHTHDYFCPQHGIRFAFDWHKPTSHFCKLCGKEWKRLRADWAWVGMAHYSNLNFLNACAYLYIATGNRHYAVHIKNLLLDYASKYPTYMLHNTRREQVKRQSGKMYAQSLDESVFASYAARAYTVAKAVMSPDEIKRIQNGYLRPCAELLLNQKSGGNWQVWHNSGIVSLGIALENDTYIDRGLNDSEYGYHILMERNVWGDGWWSEGSPTYHFYPLRAMLFTADAVRCRSIDLYDDRLRNMFVSPAFGTYHNLLFPAHNDGWYGESLIVHANLYEIASMRFEDEALENILKKIYRQTERNSIESLQNDKDLLEKELIYNITGINFKHAGVGVLRSGMNTIVLKYGPHGGSHGHPDKLSISIHNGKTELVSDLGTTAYGVPDYRHWYRKTLSHSTLTVDAADQQGTTGALIRFELDKNGGTIEALSDGAYPGVMMKRLLTLNENRLTDVFTAVSDSIHTYDYVLILTEQPTFSKKETDTILMDAGAYEKIENVKQIHVRRSISFTTGGSKVEIESLTTPEFELFWGEAPGIPARNVEAAERKKSYPIIIRTRHERLRIKTTWEL